MNETDLLEAIDALHGRISDILKTNVKDMSMFKVQRAAYHIIRAGQELSKAAQVLERK